MTLSDRLVNIALHGDLRDISDIEKKMSISPNSAAANRYQAENMQVGLEKEEKVYAYRGVGDGDGIYWEIKVSSRPGFLPLMSLHFSKSCLKIKASFLIKRFSMAKNVVTSRAEGHAKFEIPSDNIIDPFDEIDQKYTDKNNSLVGDSKNRLVAYSSGTPPDPFICCITNMLVDGLDVPNKKIVIEWREQDKIVYFFAMSQQSLLSEER